MLLLVATLNSDRQTSIIWKSCSTRTPFIATPYQDPRDWVKFGFLSYFPRQTISSYFSSKRNWLRKEKVLFWSVGHGGKKGSFWIIPLPLIAGTQKGTFFSLILSLGHDLSGQRNLSLGRGKRASFQSIHPSL